MKFNFKETVMPQKWIVDGLIPNGSIIGIVAQSAAGKSTFTDALAMYVLNGKDFLGRKTISSDVLIIDQDSQETGFKIRKKRLYNKLGTPEMHDLQIEFYSKKYFSDGSIYDAINAYPSCSLIIIDAFHKVGGKDFNYNDIRNVANAFEQLKVKCLSDDIERTIIINHHATEKTDVNFTADDYMTTGDFSKMAMGSSAFIESVDCYYVLSSPDRGKLLSKIFLRPISKRVMLPEDPFVLDVIQDDDSMDIVYSGIWEKPFPEEDDDILVYFRENKKIQTVKEICDGLGQKHPIQKIRDGLKRLRNQGYLSESHEAHNLFRYELIMSPQIRQNTSPPSPETAKTKKTKKSKNLLEG